MLFPNNHGSASRQEVCVCWGGGGKQELGPKPPGKFLRVHLIDLSETPVLIIEIRPSYTIYKPEPIEV